MLMFMWLVADEFQIDSHSLLIRGGFIRQSHAGLFQLLPLGLRIQEKLEKLLDKHMVALGASKVSLSTLSSQALWESTGRMNGDGSDSPEIFKVQDRKDAKFILSPTHEEEITKLVGSLVRSYKDLPLRLYQITRKYRDEARPRQGLLRTREFLMKDLYTFDATREAALESYETVRAAYSAFFDEFKIPFLVAKAASGEMGGDLSHEFHFPTIKGEDNIVSCDHCDYVANEELAKSALSPGLVLGPGARRTDVMKMLNFASNDNALEDPDGLYRQWFGFSKDCQILFQVIYPTRKALLLAGFETSKESRINTTSLHQALPDLDLSFKIPPWDSQDVREVHRLYDATIAPLWDLLPEEVDKIYQDRYPGSLVITHLDINFLFNHGSTELPIIERNPRSTLKGCDLLQIVDGDRCGKCSDGRLKVQPAVELGHTFYLGQRYSEPLRATYAVDPTYYDRIYTEDATDSDTEDDEYELPTELSHMKMGCHGIGVSRLIAAVADALVDQKGLNWPRVMAPFEAIVVPTQAAGIDAQTQVYDTLVSPRGSNQGSIDVILDDRQRDFGWKLTDADMIGYPVIVVIGRGWKEGKCEVQCRRLGVKQEVDIQKLRDFVEDLLSKL